LDGYGVEAFIITIDKNYSVGTTITGVDGEYILSFETEKGTSVFDVQLQLNKNTTMEKVGHGTYMG
jgi:hypothetical protein